MKTLKPFQQSGSRYCTTSDGERVCTGAMMGRSDVFPGDRAAFVKLHLERVRPVDGDYDEGGAYWGSLYYNPLYCAHTNSHAVVIYVRAKSRDAARVHVQTKLPNARFYR